jgi:hypothetical protein
MLDPPSAERARVFISYKHNIEPVQSAVDQVVLALEPHHAIFIDKKIMTHTGRLALIYAQASFAGDSANFAICRLY